MSTIVNGIRNVCRVSLLIAAVPAMAQVNLIQNGDFATGNLSDWTVLLTSNGSLGLGLPDVVPFDVTGSGTASDAAQFQAGVVRLGVPGSLAQQGGGIDQTFDCSAGSYSFSADIAAKNSGLVGNADAGLFTLLVDGTPSDSLNLGPIDAAEILRNTLEATVYLSQGSHQLSIEITRPLPAGGGVEPVNATPPFQYLDKVQAEAVPEQTSLGWLSFGVIFVCWRTKVPKRSAKKIAESTCVPGDAEA